MLQEKAHPLSKTYGLPPLENDDISPQKFPLVLFSHGLGGNMEMYTEICSQIASTGCVVVAIEHEDGSASYARKLLDNGSFETQLYDYAPPDSEIPYSRQKMVDYKGPKIEQRVKELRKVYDHFRGDDTKNAPESTVSELARQIVSVSDLDQLHLVGHSFGGATQLRAAQKWAMEQSKHSPLPTVAMATAAGSRDGSSNSDTVTFSRPDSSTSLLPVSSPEPLSVTVFDPWNFPLTNEITSKGIPKSSNHRGVQNVLSVMSENWVFKNPEHKAALEFLKNIDPAINVSSYYAKNSVHQSVSDTEAFLPSVAAKKIDNRGPEEQRHETIRALVREISKLTRAGKESNYEGGNVDDLFVPLPH